MQFIDMHGATSRRFIVNKRSQTQDPIPVKSMRFGCLVITFLGVILLLAVLVVYFAFAFPLLEGNANNRAPKLINIRHVQGTHSGKKLRLQSLISNPKSPNTHHSHPPHSNSSFIHSIAIPTATTSVYNRSLSISIRHAHQSSVHLDAAPLLVGLGAEKSGSTSMGAGLFWSGELTGPDFDDSNVETRYWSDCVSWPDFENMEQTLQQIRARKSGRCSVRSYLNFGLWLRGTHKFEKSVDYLGLPYVARIFSELFVKPHGTKIFIMIRDPAPRIASTWKFFVGAEKDQMPDEYGDVERFTRHLLKNEALLDMIALLDGDGDENDIFSLDWENVILPKWNEFMQSLQAQCIREAHIVGFRAEFCNPSQLLRRAVGLSCYIVPIMQWIVELGIQVALDSFRIIQSELYFKDGKNIMDRLLCWSKTGTIDTSNEGTCSPDTAFYKQGRIRIQKLQGTYKSQTAEFSDELLQMLRDTFRPCNDRLFELLQLYPQLALKEFEWSEWGYTNTFLN